MVQKTRDKLIEVARKLFARNGIDNTTMNDIAEASEKGRRTVYTYFKSKPDILNAAVEQESENLLARLRDVAESSLNPEEKLERYLLVRFEVLTQLTVGSPSFWNILDLYSRREAKVRMRFQEKEREVFRSMIMEGVSSGYFDPIQAERLSQIEPFIFNALGMLKVNHHVDISQDFFIESCKSVVRFIIDGTKTKNI